MTPSTIYRTYRRTSFFRRRRFLMFWTIKLTFITFACNNQYFVVDWSRRVFTGEKVNWPAAFSWITLDSHRYMAKISAAAYLRMRLISEYIRVHLRPCLVPSWCGDSRAIRDFQKPFRNPWIISIRPMAAASATLSRGKRCMTMGEWDWQRQTVLRNGLSIRALRWLKLFVRSRPHPSRTTRSPNPHPSRTVSVPSLHLSLCVWKPLKTHAMCFILVAIYSVVHFKANRSS